MRNVTAYTIQLNIGRAIGYEVPKKYLDPLTWLAFIAQIEQRAQILCERYDGEPVASGTYLCRQGSEESFFITCLFPETDYVTKEKVTADFRYIAAALGHRFKQVEIALTVSAVNELVQSEYLPLE